MKNKAVKFVTAEAVIVFALVMCEIWLLYFVKGYAPFGEDSFATEDANYQYLELFSYLKDVLAGKNSMEYSFTKSLGGGTVGIFSYYLASPLNILVVLFDKSELVVFYDVIASIKMALAGSMCALFLRYRFSAARRNNAYCKAVIILLSVGYALCQYSMMQARNIMWLDGVYMLPLILLGVFILVRDGRTWQLSVSVGLSILFNWYTGGINCLFAIGWLALELALKNAQKRSLSAGYDRRKICADCFGSLWRFGYAMFAGVMTACILFLPTVAEMRKSSKGELELLRLGDISFTGNVLTVIQDSVLGGKSAQGEVSLYCGCMALFGCIGYFISKSEPVWRKRVIAVFFIVMLLLFYWNPFYVVFSLFKSVWSYWYRYSYVGIIFIIFVAAGFYLSHSTERATVLRTVKASCVYSGVLVALDFAHESQNSQFTYRTILILLAYGVLAFALAGLVQRPGLRRRALAVVLCLLVVADSMYNSKILMTPTESDNAVVNSDYSEFTEEMPQMLGELKGYDDGDYRITQTFTRLVDGYGLRADYNESMAYNYRGIAGYTSSPDGSSMSLLTNLGYSEMAGTMNIVNTSILAADSLLGVKYVVSRYAINGLETVDEIDEAADGARVYSNPYCLPMAFVYSDNSQPEADSDNPFEYCNELYSRLLGEDAGVFIPLEYEVTKKTSKSRIYSVSIPEGNYAVYGNIPWKKFYTGKLNVNKSYTMQYASWLSPAVFYIPTKQGDTKCTVKLNSKKKVSVIKNDTCFYAVDLDRLSEVSKRIQANAATKIDIQNGKASFETSGKAGQSLYISIPYDSGWVITRNGEKAEPDLVGGCMYSIPLTDGVNRIEMTYHVKYKGLGAACSCVGLLMTAAYNVVWRRRRRIDEENCIDNTLLQ